MWNLSFTPPQVIEAKVLTRMPDGLRKAVRSEWADANKPGHVVDCFLEDDVRVKIRKVDAGETPVTSPQFEPLQPYPGQPERKSVWNYFAGKNQ